MVDLLLDLNAFLEASVLVEAAENAAAARRATAQLDAKLLAEQA